jgi:hypothetical protein
MLVAEKVRIAAGILGMGTHLICFVGSLKATGRSVLAIEAIVVDDDVRR